MTDNPGYPEKVYVASSWRCHMQPAVVAALRSLGIGHYDFRHPPERAGFGWEQVMPGFDRGQQEVHEDDYLKGLSHPLAEAGFKSDFDAMVECDACVLVLPCGRSAHLELGWFVGQGKRTAILLDGPIVQPELMYKMVDCVATSLDELFDWLGVPA